MATDPEITRELEVEKHTGLWLPHVYSTSACNGQKQITDRHTNLAVTFLFFTIPHVWIRWFISQIRQLAYTDDDGLSLIIYGANDTGFFILSNILSLLTFLATWYVSHAPCPRIHVAQQWANCCCPFCVAVTYRFSERLCCNPVKLLHQLLSIDRLLSKQHLISTTDCSEHWFRHVAM